jgi:hypothetical protein
MKQLRYLESLEGGLYPTEPGAARKSGESGRRVKLWNLGRTIEKMDPIENLEDLEQLYHKKSLEDMETMNDLDNLNKLPSLIKL